MTLNGPLGVSHSIHFENLNLNNSGTLVYKAPHNGNRPDDNDLTTTATTINNKAGATCIITSDSANFGPSSVQTIPTVGVFNNAGTKLALP